MSDETTQTETPLEVKNRELLAEKKTLQARFAVLEKAAQAVGVDVTNPEAFLSSHESATRARQERERLVRDAVHHRVMEQGIPVNRKLAEGLVAAAIADSEVSIGEDGSVSGAAELADVFLGSLKATPQEPRKLPSGVTVDKPRIHGEAELAPSTFTELLQQGPAAVSALFQRDRAKYDALLRAHNEGMAHPRRGHPTG